MLYRDLKYGLHQLYKSPGFSAVAILTSALGIGMTAAMFTVVYAVLLRPLPFKDPERVVSIGQANRPDNHPGTSSLPNIRDWREQAQSFEGIAYWNLSVHNLKSEGGSESVADIRCSSNLFPVLKAQPMIGRGFLPEEGEPGKGNVAVLSAKLWRGLFASRPDAIGAQVEMGGDYFTVVGVMPDDFTFPLAQDDSIVWSPVQPKKEWEDRNMAMLQVVGRLKDGASVESARAELATIASRTATDDNAGDANRVLVEDYRESLTGDVKSSLWSLKAAVLAVWLVACINVVALLLARATSRRREIAIRCALGASQARLLRQFLTESALLGGLSGALGLLLCLGLIRVMRFYLESKLPFADAIEINLPVVAAILFLSLVSTLIFGTWPALQAYWTTPQEALRDGSAAAGTSRRQKRVRDLLVICEVALSLVLLLNAGLLLRTIYNLRSTPLGFAPDHLIIAQVPLSQAAAGADITQTVYDPLLRELREVPGVKSSAISTILPMDPGSTSKMPVQIFGRPAGSTRGATAELRVVSPDIYRTLGIRLIDGRLFAETDGRSAPWVLVVNQAFARKYFPDEDPLGKQIRTNDSGPNKYSTIIGVVEDARQKSLTDAVEPEINLSYAQLKPEDDFYAMLGFFVQVAVRTETDPSGVAPSLRAALRRINPEAVPNITTMETIVDRSIGSQMLAARLIGIFAGSALLITAIGLYGLLAYNVSSSTRDIAIRLALGAGRPRVLLTVLRHAALVMGIGAVIGFVLWDQTAKLLRSYLYGIGTHDPWTIVAVAAVLLACGLLASYVPARRASRVDPMSTLRHE